MDDDRLRDLRVEYEIAGLDVGDVDPDPFAQFRIWFDQAVAADLPEPNTMVLSTVSRDGQPSGRAVLLRELDDRGFVFFTNYASQKGVELDENPLASICFLWLPLHRQVRVEGTVDKIATADSDVYFASRPRPARLGANASPQSRAIPDRAWLRRRVEEMDRVFAGVEVTRPAGWGGFRLVPAQFEFWQGQPDRLHDRLRYRPSKTGWDIERLAP